MKVSSLVAAALAGCFAALGAQAAAVAAVPSVGAAAPAVAGKSVLSQKIVDFDLSKELANGAVVLYFFPQAFSSD